MRPPYALLLHAQCQSKPLHALVCRHRPTVDPVEIEIQETVLKKPGGSELADAASPVAPVADDDCELGAAVYEGQRLQADVANMPVARMTDGPDNEFVPVQRLHVSPEVRVGPHELGMRIEAADILILEPRAVWAVEIRLS